MKKETRKTLECKPTPFGKLHTIYIQVFAHLLNVHNIILPVHTQHLYYTKNAGFYNKYLPKICSCKSTETLQDRVKLKQAQFVSSLLFPRQCPSVLLFVIICFGLSLIDYSHFIFIPTNS